MHPEAITKKASQLLASLSGRLFIKNFYLAGGTGLALQYGHRSSVDFDFFCTKSFSIKELKNDLCKNSDMSIILEEADTLIVELGGVKTSFFEYRYPLLFPFKNYQGASLADPRDIACMKLDAISGRGGKKDFIDLYFILQHYSLTSLLELFNQKFKNTSYNSAHLLKSLVYFVDADKEPLPRMIAGINWTKIKKELSSKVKVCLAK